MIPGLILTHIADAKERLLEQYKGKPKLEAMLDAFNKDVQALENVFSDIYVSNNIADAYGVSLDNLGTIVGQPRLGFEDERYRSFILAKIGENTSQGDPEKILQVVRLLSTANLAMIQDWYPAAFGLSFSKAIPSGLINFFYDRLNNVASAGVRLEGLTVFDDTDAFAFAGSVGEADGFGDSADADVGGKLAELQLQNLTGYFQFADLEGFATEGDGFSSLNDNLVGGIFE